MVDEKKYEEMSALELKGVLFDLNTQIQDIQLFAQKTILPLLDKKVKEEKGV